MPIPATVSDARSFVLGALLLVVLGCEAKVDKFGGSGPPVDEAGGDETVCSVSVRELLPNELQSDRGDSAMDVFLGLSGARSGTVDWLGAGELYRFLSVEPGSGTAVVAWDLVPNVGSGRYLESEAVDGSNRCVDTIEFDYRLQLHSDDGAFDEVFPVTLSRLAVAEWIGSTAASVDLLDEDLMGGFDVQFNHPEMWDEISLSLVLTISPERVDGVIGAVGRDEHTTLQGKLASFAVGPVE